MVVAPLVIIFIGLPWAWWAIKLVWSALVWCCTWNQYVYEEDLKDD